MSSVNKISQILMLLAWMILVLHSAIPHHHHIDCSGVEKNTSIVSNNFEDNCADGELSHCHAFNNIEVEITDTFNKLKDTPVNLLFSSIFFSPFSQQNDEEKVYESTFAQQVIIPKQFLISQLFFRGPPSQAYILLQNHL